MLDTLDWIAIAAYFAVLLGIAWWVVRQKQQSAADYFLAGRHVGWFVVGASIFASNVGSEHVVGLAGTGFQDGVVMGHYELHSWLVLLLGWVFVPFYMRSQVFTMPEFLERRYSPAARWFLSIISLCGYVLTKVSVTVYAGAVVFEALMGISFWTGALSIVLLTGLYTVAGGMRAVVYTEALQAIVLLVGSIAVTLAGLAKMGATAATGGGLVAGWREVVEAVGPEHLDMFLPADHPAFPWPGMLMAAPIVGLWYWCTDQYIVQRTLAARDLQQARRGTLFAAILKLFPFFIFIIPGVIAYALSRRGQLEVPAPDQTFATMVRSLLPSGLRGLVAGGLLAALMSSLAAVFNSCSTLFTIDIYKKMRPQASERQLVRTGRVATVVVVGLGIAWIPVMRLISGQLYTYLQSVQAYVAPPIAAVFLLGLFWSRINARGAVAALVGGFVLGMLRLVAEINKDHLTGALHGFASLNFLYFCALLFAASLAILVVVSLLGPAPDPERIRGLTYATTARADRDADRKTWSAVDVVGSLVVVGIIVAVMLAFSGCAAPRPPVPAPAGAVTTAPTPATGPLTVYVGTYTRGTESRGIYRLELDIDSGALHPVDATGDIENPTFLALAPSGRHLYAVGEVSEVDGTRTGLVHAFAIDPATHALAPRGRQPSRGAGPCHLQVDRAGRHVLVANYGGGSAAVLPIAEDGGLLPATGFVQHEGRGADPRRQEAPHAHAINLDPSGRFAVVSDLGLDRLMVYRYDARAGTLTPHAPAFLALPPGTGPRHLAFHPNGTLALSNGELTNDVTALAWDAGAGTLRTLHTLSTLPEGHAGGTTAEVVIHPSGRFAYVSNRGHDSLAIFRIAADGRLTALGHQPTGGSTPRNFALTPDGRLLVVANQKTNDLHVFRVDSETGLLAPTGHTATVPAPVCVRFLTHGAAAR